MVNQQHKLLSIIVPAYKQAKTIKKDLENIDSVLTQGLKDTMDFEIICVVDGMLDDTLKQARRVKSSKVKILSYKNNRGKGYAIRFGMAYSKGDLVSFLDAGMEISPRSIMMLMTHMEWYDADIIVGSKRHPVSRVNYPLLRHILSIGYHWMVKILFGLNITDTQSGIKIFEREVMEKVLPRLLVKRYAIDIEMLAAAYRLGYKRIYEAPIEVTFDKRTSRISWTTILKMMWDTITVFYRLYIIKYYDNKNQLKWNIDPDIKFDFKSNQ